MEKCSAFQNIQAKNMYLGFTRATVLFDLYIAPQERERETERERKRERDANYVR